MKTFKDLVFKPHSNGIDGTRAVMVFENGYGVSVIAGPMFYTDADHPYELAVLRNKLLCYDTPITNDVIGHLKGRDVTKYMRQVQELPRVKK